MGKIFEKQTKLHIEATMNIDIAGATEHVIKYIKPDKSTGEFAATIKTASTGVLEYDVNIDGSDVNCFGNWPLWGFVTLADGKKIAGEAKIMRVFKEGA